MAYKISKKSSKIPASYWKEQEILRLRKKYKGKLPPITEISRVGTRRTLGIQEKVHKKGSIVEYKEGMARVKKVTKRGLWIEPFTKPDKEIAYPSGKVIFIPEKRVEREIYPFFTNLPIYFEPFFMMK
jgi:hypothetical protein